MNLQQYQQVNSSFSRRLVFHMGYDSGFFAEFTYMVNAMLYCLDHKLQFTMYSDDANFGTGQGWTEYFLPFCDELHDSFHHRHNRHTPPTWREVFGTAIKWKQPGIIAWRLKNIVSHQTGKIAAWRAYGQYTQLGQDVHIDTRKRYVIPELGLDADYLDAFNELARMVWRFNPVMLEAKAKALAELQLPESYAGTQIRGGDKVIETDLISNEVFMNALNKTGETCVFLLTDDYRIFQQTNKQTTPTSEHCAVPTKKATSTKSFARKTRT